MTIGTTDRSVFFLIAIAVIAVLVLGFFIYRQIGIRADLLEEIETEKTEVALAESRLEHLKDLAARSDEMEESLETMAKLIPDTPQEDELIVLINREAEEAEIGFMEIRFDERSESEEHGYIEMPINLAFEGRYLQAIELLKALDNLERGVRIDDIKMGRGREELPVLNINVRGSVFYAGN
ncbi:MAG: type 4a pilus biogenesis protein PilO [Bacillota bacterium]